MTTTSQGLAAKSGSPVPGAESDRATTAAEIAARSAPVMVALDIDGTITASGSLDVPAQTVAAVAETLAAGHHVVLASGRSVPGVMSIARALRLETGWFIASNGAVIARVGPDGYMFDAGDVRTVDARQVIFAALNARLPGLQIAVEEIGVGYYVNTSFPPGLLRGKQTVLPVHELPALATPRIVLRAPGVHALIRPLRAVGLTATPAENNWLDITGPGLSKATALETVRRRLQVRPRDTVAVGDGINDLPMLAWAARGIALREAPPRVSAAAAEITGTLAEHAVATVLRSITNEGAR